MSLMYFPLKMVSCCIFTRFGFVEFENEETSKAVKEDMEDCEIDGSKVMVAYAKTKGDKGQGAKRKSAGGNTEIKEHIMKRSGAHKWI